MGIKCEKSLNRRFFTRQICACGPNFAGTRKGMVSSMRMYEQHEKCDLPTETKLYKIGMFAQMNHVTVKTLRFYEEQGLLIPAYVDEENGYRYYTLDQMSVIHQITALKQVGFTLEDIKHINVEDDEEKFLQKKKSQLHSLLITMRK